MKKPISKFEPKQLNLIKPHLSKRKISPDVEKKSVSNGNLPEDDHSQEKEVSQPAAEFKVPQSDFLPPSDTHLFGMGKCKCSSSDDLVFSWHAQLYRPKFLLYKQW